MPALCSEIEQITGYTGKCKRYKFKTPYIFYGTLDKTWGKISGISPAYIQKERVTVSRG